MVSSTCLKECFLRTSGSAGKPLGKTGLNPCLTSCEIRSAQSNNGRAGARTLPDLPFPLLDYLVVLLVDAGSHHFLLNLLEPLGQVFLICIRQDPVRHRVEGIV